MSVQRPRAPEWLYWESAVAEMIGAAREYAINTPVKFVDHTDRYLVLDVVGFDGAGFAAEQKTERCTVFARELQRIFPWADAQIRCTALEWPKHPQFLNGRKWRVARYATLLTQGNWCRCCGARPPDAELHVDHIVPRSLDPALALELSNLQVLCRDCNLGKSNRDSKDWRGLADA